MLAIKKLTKRQQIEEEYSEIVRLENQLESSLSLSPGSSGSSYEWSAWKAKRTKLSTKIGKMKASFFDKWSH